MRPKENALVSAPQVQVVERDARIETRPLTERLLQAQSLIVTTAAEHLRAQRVVPSVMMPSRACAVSSKYAPPIRPPNSGQPNALHSCCTLTGCSVASTRNATEGKPALRTRNVSRSMAPSSSGTLTGWVRRNCRPLSREVQLARRPRSRPSSAPPCHFNCDCSTCVVRLGGASSSSESSLVESASQCHSPLNVDRFRLPAPSSTVTSLKCRSMRRGLAVGHRQLAADAAAGLHRFEVRVDEQRLQVALVGTGKFQRRQLYIEITHWLFQIQLAVARFPTLARHPHDPA